MLVVLFFTYFITYASYEKLWTMYFVSLEELKMHEKTKQRDETKIRLISQSRDPPPY